MPWTLISTVSLSRSPSPDVNLLPLSISFPRSFDLPLSISFPLSISSSQSQQVRASHLLIKHSGSRRKAYWKDPEGQVIKNTSRDSAVAQLKTLREEIITNKARFEDLASCYSDCSSAKRGGDLGTIMWRGL